MKAKEVVLSALMCAALALLAAEATFAADVPRVPAVNAKLEAHLPGKFIWFDCVTEDPYASKAFYGALFGVLKSDSGDPPDRPVAAGEFLWVDLYTRDPAKAAEFYRGLAAFEVSVKGAAPEIVRHVLATGGVACASHRDDYGGSNDIGYSPMYGAYDGAYDGSWNWSPGYYPSAIFINIGPVD